MRKIITSSNFILALILIIAGFLRLYQLSSLPISLFGDEVDVGYHAWSLATTGKDYLGHFLPTYIQSLSESRAPLLMYVTAPFIWLLGPSTLSVRLPEVVFGLLSIALLYFVSLNIFSKNAKIYGLIAASVLALAPWHIHYSRSAFEVVLLLFLILLGLFLFLKENYYASLIPFALSVYDYSVATVFIPLFVLLLLFVFKPKLNLKKNWLKLVLPVIVVIPFIYSVLSGQAGARFGKISVFNDQNLIYNIGVRRSEPWIGSHLLENIFNNKYSAFVYTIANNYVHALSVDYIFVKGDPFPRQSVSQGEFLWVLFPLYLAGLFICFKNIREKESKLLLGWLLISPISSSLTQGGDSHATRLFVMIAPVALLIAYGFTVVFSLPKKLSQALLLIISIAAMVSFANFYYLYSNHYRYESAIYWSYGYQDIFNQLTPLLGKANNIYINNTSDPSLIRFAFFTKLPPKDFQRLFTTDNQTSYTDGNFTGFKFGSNMYFGQANDLQKLLKSGDIYLAVQGKEVPGDWDWSKSPPSGLTVLGKTNDVYGKPLFYLVGRKP